MKNRTPKQPTEPQRMTEQRIAFLVPLIIPEEGVNLPIDLRAAALIELVSSIADDKDDSHRDLCDAIVEAQAYRLTDACADGCRDFYTAVYAGSVDRMLEKLKKENAQ